MKKLLAIFKKQYLSFVEQLAKEFVVELNINSE
jgi:hypothetical protein